MSRKFTPLDMKLSNGVKKYKTGFTLIEMLMSIFILIIIVIGASGIYVYSMKAQQKTLQLNIVAQEVQYIFDTISRKVRESEIDYAYYDDTWNVEDTMDIDIDGDGESDNPFEKNVLAIYNENQDRWWVETANYIYRGAVLVQDGEHLSVCFCEYRCETSSCDAGLGFIPITTNKLKVMDLQFDIKPGESPFTDSDALQKQPRMTMKLKLEGAGEILTVQQTVPQRFLEKK